MPAVVKYKIQDSYCLAFVWGKFTAFLNDLPVWVFYAGRWLLPFCRYIDDTPSLDHFFPQNLTSAQYKPKDTKKVTNQA